MKIIRQNLTLSIAIALSLLAHGTLLAVRIVAPDALKFQPRDPGLEVILVNAKHAKKPLKADAIAQADLDGGGNADAGRSKSPIPDMNTSEDGEDVKEAQRHVEELEIEQQKMLSQLMNKNSVVVPPRVDKDKPHDTPLQPTALNDTENTHPLRRTAAEIAKEVYDYNKRPKKTQITPNTQGEAYAQYYKAMQAKIEYMGTVNFPQKGGRKMYGKLIVYIPIFQDGSIYEREGGPKVERTSGNKALDAAALHIVRMAAPFKHIPANMRTGDKDQVWEMVTHFNFTREAALETELRSGVK